MLKTSLFMTAMFLSIAAEQVLPTRAALQPAPAEVQTTALAALMVQVVLSILFYAAAVQSDLSGWRLYGALFCIYYGLHIVMAQVEAFIFLPALAPLTRADLVQIMLKNQVVISFYLAVVVLLAERWRSRSTAAPALGGGDRQPAACLENRLAGPGLSGVLLWLWPVGGLAV